MVSCVVVKMANSRRDEIGAHGDKRGDREESVGSQRVVDIAFCTPYDLGPRFPMMLKF